MEENGTPTWKIQFNSLEEKTAYYSQFYRNKVILAPMVKIGSLAFRLLALRYGADLVYSEEIIDRKFLNSVRIVNEVAKTIDYLDKTDGTIFFQTCEEERSKVVLQIGTCDPTNALKVAKLVENDVFAIDINMGCPKEFSVLGGMGAALLKEPEKIKAILTTLVSNLKISVTCKIRLVNTEVENTIELCKMIESCGVSAVGVHGRTKEERPRHPNRNHFLKLIAERLKIPVIANGCSREIKTFEDIEKYRVETGCSSIMIARAAEWNPSILSRAGKEGVHDMVRKYLTICLDTRNPFSTTKYTIQSMLKEIQESPLGKRFLATQTVEELCDIWEMKDIFHKKELDYNEKKKQLNNDVTNRSGLNTSEDGPTPPKKIKITRDGDSSEDSLPLITVPNCAFIRGHYPDVQKLPKSILFKWSRSRQMNDPYYVIEFKDKRFRSKVVVEDKVFMTDVWEKNKKFAEQGAALACIRHLNLL